MDNSLLTLDTIRAKRQMRLDDSFDDEGSWATLNGTHVHFNNEGDIDKGPAALKEKLNKHEYSTKAEYQREKAKALKRRDALLKRLDRDKERRRAETIKKFGGSPAERRMEIRMDKSLTDEEKEAKIDEVFRDQERMMEEHQKFSQAYNKQFKEIHDNYRASFDADYEYKKIEGDNGLENNAGTDIINPNGLLRNCQRCAMAYEMRARGYDVTVSPGESGALANPARILQCFVNPDRADFADFGPGGDYTIAKGVMKQMHEWGEGARCYVLAQYGSHGHAFNLENVGGKVIVRDAQTGVSWDAEDGWSSTTHALRLVGAVDVTLVRTDNAKLSLDVLDYVQEVA